MPLRILIRYTTLSWRLFLSNLWKQLVVCFVETLKISENQCLLRGWVWREWSKIPPPSCSQHNLFPAQFHSNWITFLPTSQGSEPCIHETHVTYTALLLKAQIFLFLQLVTLFCTTVKKAMMFLNCYFVWWFF